VVNLFLDIETIPAPEEEIDKVKYLFAKIQARRVKKPPVENQREYTFTDFYKNTCFDGAFGRILCIGYAVDKEPVAVIYHSHNEKRILQEFWQIAKKADCFIGYNLFEFDLKIIWQRSVKFGVKPTKNLDFAKFSNFPIYDIAKEWSRWGSVKDSGLEHLALALGLESPKDHLDGSQVWEYFQTGKIKEICQYCQKDVVTTRDIYRQMIFQ
jgi:predicted PolB exonuclease-like 3'-5' exonuclease